jgi:hypothetical protein
VTGSEAAACIDASNPSTPPTPDAPGLGITGAAVRTAGYPDPGIGRAIDAREPAGVQRDLPRGAKGLGGSRSCVIQGASVRR